MNPRPSAAYSNSPAPAQGHLSVDWAQHPDEPVARVSLAIAPLGRASALLEVQASGAGRNGQRDACNWFVRVLGPIHGQMALGIPDRLHWGEDSCVFTASREVKMRGIATRRGRTRTRPSTASKCRSGTLGIACCSTHSATKNAIVLYCKKNLAQVGSAGSWFPARCAFAAPRTSRRPPGSLSRSSRPRHACCSTHSATKRMLLYCIEKKSRLKCWLATRGRTRNRSSGTRATACWSSGVTGSARGDWRPWLPGCPPPSPASFLRGTSRAPPPSAAPPRGRPQAKGFLRGSVGGCPL